MTCYLYIGESLSDDGSYKIGVSQDPVGRLISLQSALGRPMKLLWTAEVSDRSKALMVERRLKNHLQKYLSKKPPKLSPTEWFQCSETIILDYAQELCKKHKTELIAPPPHIHLPKWLDPIGTNKLARYIESHTTAQAIATALKVSTSTITRIANDELHPKAWLAWAIEKHTGGKVKVSSWKRPKKDQGK